MKQKDKNVWAELILIVGGFILAETLIRNFLELSKGILAPWVLPVFAISLIFGAVELKNGESKRFSEWIYTIFIGFAILLIVLVKTGKIEGMTFVWLILISSVVSFCSWIFEIWYLKKKKN
jgi:hypothetical protein